MFRMKLGKFLGVSVRWELGLSLQVGKSIITQKSAHIIMKQGFLTALEHFMFVYIVECWKISRENLVKCTYFGFSMSCFRVCKKFCFILKKNFCFVMAVQ